MKDPILQIVTRLILPYIQVFGIYLILYGHLSPGGGFAGGTVVAAGLLLVSLAYGGERARQMFPRHLTVFLESAGGIWFIILGLLGLMLGQGLLTNLGEGAFWIDTPLTSGRLIVFLSLGVGLKVASTIFSIFQELAGGGEE